MSRPLKPVTSTDTRQRADVNSHGSNLTTLDPIMIVQIYCYETLYCDAIRFLYLQGYFEYVTETRATQRTGTRLQIIGCKLCSRLLLN